MNVQVASGCIKKWYETIEIVSRCNSEVLIKKRVAPMPLPWMDETRTSKSCIRTAFFGDQGDPKRPPILEDLRRSDLT